MFFTPSILQTATKKLDTNWRPLPVGILNWIPMSASQHFNRRRATDKELVLCAGMAFVTLGYLLDMTTNSGLGCFVLARVHVRPYQFIGGSCPGRTVQPAFPSTCRALCTWAAITDYSVAVIGYVRSVLLFSHRFVHTTLAQVSDIK